MDPIPDHGEDSYVGSGKLTDRIALITGGDSGIGRAVALAYTREGADVMIAYLSETEDAEATKTLVENEGRRCELFEGDLAQPSVCRDLVAATVEAFGRIDILVNNAAHQMSLDSLEEVPDEEWERTFAVNISAMFYITKAALPHMGRGASIINTASVNADKPNPQAAGLCHHQGRHPELHRRFGAVAGRVRHPRQQRRARPDLDPPSFPPQCRRTRSASSAATRRSDAQDSPPNWPGSMSCSPPTRAAISPAPCSG